ncbi:Thiamine-phosphate synthase [Candidatus Entotheonellaceae bacterium PAL068K]
MAPETVPLGFHLYIVTDRQQTAGRPLEEVLVAAACGGAAAVQLRAKDLSARQLYSLGARLQEVLAPYRVPLLINDRVDVALALDAAGVHLAGHSLQTAQTRRLVGPEKLIGVSTHSLVDARQAALEGADFIVFGPVFSTPSKLAYGAPQGLQKLAAVTHQVNIPVLAIGGIDVTNLCQVMQAGAHGVAMIRAILTASDPREATRQISAMLA